MTGAFVKRACIALAALAIVGLPGVALACSVCGAAANEASKTAFIVATAFMTTFPLLMIGLVAWWYVRKIRQAEDDRRHELIDATRPPNERVGAYTR